MANSNWFLRFAGQPKKTNQSDIFRIFFYLIMKIYFMYSLESPYQGDSNEYSQHTIIYRISRTNVHGPNDVRAITARLYIHLKVREL